MRTKLFFVQTSIGICSLYGRIIYANVGTFWTAKALEKGLILRGATRWSWWTVCAAILELGLNLGETVMRCGHGDNLEILDKIGRSFGQFLDEFYGQLHQFLCNV